MSRAQPCYLGYVAYHLLRLDKGNTLKPTPGLYLIPIHSKKVPKTKIQVEKNGETNHFSDTGDRDRKPEKY